SQSASPVEGSITSSVLPVSTQLPLISAPLGTRSTTSRSVETRMGRSYNPWFWVDPSGDRDCWICRRGAARLVAGGRLAGPESRNLRPTCQTRDDRLPANCEVRRRG